MATTQSEDEGWCVLSDPEIAPVTVLEDHWDSSSTGSRESAADEQVEAAQRVEQPQQAEAADDGEAAWRSQLVVGQLIDALDTDMKW